MPGLVSPAAWLCLQGRLCAQCARSAKSLHHRNCQDLIASLWVCTSVMGHVLMKMLPDRLCVVRFFLLQGVMVFLGATD